MFARTSSWKLCQSSFSAAVSHCPQQRVVSQPAVSAIRSSQNSPSFSERGLRGSMKYSQLSPARNIGYKHQPDARHSSRSFSNRAAPSELPNEDIYKLESTQAGEPTIHAIFENNTSTWQYIVADPASSCAVIIDPVLDYNQTNQTISTESADFLRSIVRDQGYRITMILETHVHADHVTAASYLQARLAQDQALRPPIGIGKRIEQVQNLFGRRYGVPEAEYKAIFGKYFDDDEVFNIGSLSAHVLHLPGHTPDHLGYKIGDNVFCGDSIFHADIGTARCDFPGGSANDMFQSGRKLLGLSDSVKIWTGHDYPPPGRDGPVPYMTVQEHRLHNKHLVDGTTLDAYIAMREERDKQMSEPRLLHPSLQVNIRAGRLPGLTPSGQRLLHLPMKFDGVEWPMDK